MRITQVEFPLAGSKITYCGLPDDDVYWPGSGFGLLERTTAAYALCLNTSLVDMEQRTLFAIRYGLETSVTYFRQTRAVRPREDRLKNPQRIQKAIDETLGELAPSTPK